MPARRRTNLRSAAPAEMSSTAPGPTVSWRENVLAAAIKDLEI